MPYFNPLDNDNTNLIALMEDHDNIVNHNGVSGAMEIQGDLRIFKRSMEQSDSKT